MRIAFLDLDTVGRDLDLSALAALGDLDVHGWTEPDRVAERLRGVDAVVCNKTRLHEGNLAGADRLRLICITGTGTDGVDKAYCAAHGIQVRNVRGYSTDSVVQHAFAMLLELIERTSRFDAYARSGAYVGDTSFRYLGWTFHELAGLRFGILGMGAIGRKVADVAAAFGCAPVYWSSTGADRDPRYPRLGLEEILRTSDVVSIHAPLDDRTRGLLSDGELAWMKPTAILLNLGRGGIVDEAALARALAAGRPALCGLDVLTAEPMAPDSPLLPALASGRLLVTPHVAWASVESRTRCVAEVAANIADFLAGGGRNRVA